MLIRPFQAPDTNAVISLWQACRLTSPWNDPAKDIERKLAVQPDLFLVGELGGRIIASAMGGYDGHRGNVYYLGIHPDHQGRGYGAAIMSALEARFLAVGCPKVNLLVRGGNEAVEGFYARLGYERHDVGSYGKRLIPDHTKSSA
jgi:ribosomal protein S18 acetylase RimI-like enzyme